MANTDYGVGPLEVLAADLSESAAKEAERRVQPDNLADHIFNTYWWLRFGLGCLGLIFPLVVVLCHRPDPLIALPGATDLVGRDVIRPSLSAYYNSRQVGHFFIGELFAVGVCLIFYRGFTRKEDAALNAAGIFAIGVSLIPYDSGVGQLTIPVLGQGAAVITAHGVCAVLYLVSLWYVAWFRAADTLYVYKAPRRVRRYRFWYRFFAVMMIAGVAVAGVLRTVEIYRPFATLIAETIGSWGFAGYWLLKGFEIRRRIDSSDSTLQP